jgi:predicted component of type VI protein secretion system
MDNSTLKQLEAIQKNLKGMLNTLVPKSVLDEMSEEDRKVFNECKNIAFKKGVDPYEAMKVVKKKMKRYGS